MAVETGTASGWLDLLDKLVTFAVANGWVVEKSVTVTAGQVEERDYAALTTAHPTVSAENEAGLSLPVLAKVPGAGGDSIVTTETLTNGSWGGATLSGGGTSQTYRIFPNIARNAKNHFFCIKEV
jgi:hypothetical protein